MAFFQPTLIQNVALDDAGTIGIDVSQPA